MEWFETDELALITGTIRDISASEIEGKVVDLESLARPEFPRAAIDTFSDLGFLWGPAPEDIGSGMDEITTVVILSGLAETSAGFSAIVACHYAAIRSLLALPDGPAVLRAACEGNGSRPPLLGVAVERDISLCEASGGGIEYACMPAPDKVDRTVLFAGTGPGTRMFLSSGAALSRYSEADGLSGCDEMPTSKLALPGEVIDSLQPVASGADASIARDSMVSALKLHFSAAMQGTARAATAYALDYARRRRQTGRAIIDHQNVRKKLVDMEIKNQSMASFLYRAACSDSGAGFNLEDMLYAFTKTESEHVVNEAVQSLGGYGYIKEYGLEKKLRDVKALQALLATPLHDWLGSRA
ncbi:MAG: acyl-CoA dehydrogenase family protein [Candidatus Geothermincolia bacterium]